VPNPTAADDFRLTAPVAMCVRPADQPAAAAPVDMCFRPGDRPVSPCFHPSDHLPPGDDCFHPGDDVAADLHRALTGAEERDLAALAARS
jgi:hypothetical protein